MNTITTVMRLLVGLICIPAIGWPTVQALWSGGRRPVEWIERGALAFGIGAGILTWAMLCVALVGLKQSLANTLISGLICTLGLAGILIAAQRLGAGQTRPSPAPQTALQPRLSLLEGICLAVVIFEVAWVLVEALAYPMSAHDPLAHWGLKSKAFFLHKDISFEGMQAHNYYPNLIPLLETWIYLAIGRIDDGLVKALFPLCFIALVALFYTFQRRAGLSRKHALLFTAVMTTSGGQLVHFSTIGYADVPLTLFYTVSTVLLYLWMVSPKESRYLVMSGLFAGICTWTKLEGIVLVAVNSLVLLVYLMRFRQRMRQSAMHLAEYGFLVVLFVVPWFLFRQMHNLSGSGEHLGGLRFGPLPVIVQQLVLATLDFRRWGALWPVAIAMSALTLKATLSSPTAYLLLIVVLNAGSLVATYLATSATDIVQHILASVQRLLLHFAPIVVFLMSLQAAEILKGIPSRVLQESADGLS